ncbi:kinesin-like protein KIF9 isoform X2 [Bolinopsis microptera]|uniref:kinesin-like protein KIF9 isoform X2 n=1 Tax=Bolinopsis microptera TaxID=2820187 RepID=UPI00307AA97A
MAHNRVKVVVRVRPTNNFAHNYIEILEDSKVVVHSNKHPIGHINNQVSDWSFPMDRVFHNAAQDSVYNDCVSQIVDKALDGYNGTVMAYGQTGAGKTFTITGSTENFQERGMIPRALSHLYQSINSMIEHSVIVRVSYMEIYNEILTDLLADENEEPKTLTISEDAGLTVVKGLNVRLADNEEEALNLLFEGETNRVIAEHALNHASSRSHCVFTVHIESRSRTQSSSNFTLSKLNFVDLAGSERLGKTKSEGLTKKEAMYINQSLTFLEQVIIAVADRKREHVPFRQSKLTHVLKDSIGGNCNTVMIANIWGEAAQLEETISTLRFGTRMMCVANEPLQNVHFDPVLLVKEYEQEIKSLKMELAMHDTLANRSNVSYETYTESQQYDLQQMIRRYISGSLTDIEIVNLRQVKEIFKQFRTIVLSQEKEIEARMIQKYNIDLTADGSKSSRRGSDADGGVGETDGTGFGLGVAPPTAKLEKAAVVETRKLKSRKTPKERVGSGGKKSSQPPSPQEEVPELPPPITPALSSIPPLHPPSSPPTKADAFEEFKRERGSEINRIFVENKKTLGDKKRSAKELAAVINKSKKKIDSTASLLANMRAERIAEEGEAAENVYEEEEFKLLTELKELKKGYKENHGELKSVQSDISYCQRLVDQARQRLVQEFDMWYLESFVQLGDQTRPSTTTAPLTAMAPSPSPQTVEDNQEKFERLQLELMMENPESIPYLNAKKKMEKRAIYQPKMPGKIKSTVRNAPPTVMSKV